MPRITGSTASINITNPRSARVIAMTPSMVRSNTSSGLSEEFRSCESLYKSNRRSSGSCGLVIPYSRFLVGNFSGLALLICVDIVANESLGEFVDNIHGFSPGSIFFNKAAGPAARARGFQKTRQFEHQSCPRYKPLHVRRTV